jgi:uncharacterized protein (DUF58 family)
MKKMYLKMTFYLMIIILLSSCNGTFVWTTKDIGAALFIALLLLFVFSYLIVLGFSKLQNFWKKLFKK